MRHVLAALSLAAIVVGGLAAYWNVRANYRVANSGPASDPRSFIVNCPTVDGGPSNGVDMRVPADGGGPPILMDSFTASSTSSTCVRISGTDVTSSTGQPVGSGCAAGSSIGWDARNARCASTGATVGVMMTIGRQ